MPPNFPTSLDALANPTPTTLRNDPGFSLAGQIATLNDIAEALEAKLGIGASTPGASGGVLRRTGTGASGWGALQTGDMAAVGANQVIRADGSGVVGAGLLAAANVTDGAIIKQLQSTTVGAGGGTINFPSISQSYQHLLLVLHGRSSAAAASDGVAVRANGDTGSSTNYFGQFLVGAGSSASASEITPGSAQATIGYVPGASAPSGLYFSGLVAIIPGYTSTAGYKSIISLSGVMSGASTGNFSARVHSMTYASASAVTSLLVFALTSPTTLAQNSVATLYGLN